MLLQGCLRWRLLAGIFCDCGGWFCFVGFPCWLLLTGRSACLVRSCLFMLCIHTCFVSLLCGIWVGPLLFLFDLLALAGVA